MEMHEPIADNAARGVRDLQGDLSVEGKKWGEGSIRMPLDPEQAPILLAAALGQSTITALGGGLFRHVFTRKENNEPLTIDFWNDRVVDKVDFPSATIDTLDLEFSEDIASINVSVQSKFPTVAPQSVTPVYDDEQIYIFKDAKVELGTNGAGSTELKLREFSMNIANNIERIYAPNSNDVDRILTKGFEVSGSFRVLFEDETYKDAFTNLSKRSLGVVFNEGATTGEIKIYFPKIRIQGYDQSRPIDDLSEETIEFMVESTNNPVQIQVTNEKANYL